MDKASSSFAFTPIINSFNNFVSPTATVGTPITFIGWVDKPILKVIASAINALEVHGLDRCPDRGIEGFKRYVALAIVARNIQRLGAILHKQEQKRLKRKENDSRQNSVFEFAA